MSKSDFLFFLGATALLFLGHLFRSSRWGIILGRPKNEELRLRFTALSAGYIINALLPFRIGEFVRCWLFSAQSKSSLALSVGSVVVERIFDLFALALIYFAYGFFLSGFPALAALKLFGLASFLLAAIYWIKLSSAGRKIVWAVASVFNDKIRFFLLDASMALTECMGTTLKAAGLFVIQSVAMWGLYLASYALIGRAIHYDFSHVMAFFYGNFFHSVVYQLLETDLQTAGALAFYTVSPILLVLVYAYFQKLLPLGLGRSLWWLTDPLLRFERRANDCFSASEEYGAFLYRHFSGDASLTSDFDTHAIQDAKVIRHLAGGSDALTALVQVNNQLRYRKYAVGGAAKKLGDQAEWLEAHKIELPLTPVFDKRVNGERCIYDMPYSMSSRDFYDYIHMSDIEDSWKTLSDILSHIHAFHTAHEGKDADDALVRKYVQEKAVKNFHTIETTFPDICGAKEIVVNGKAISTEKIKKLVCEEYLLPRLSKRKTAIIHGDLTIENIIFDPKTPKGWYLIDPNVGNVFETPLQDYAKLFQSLHLGYEPLNRNVPCCLSERGIEFFIPRTTYYDALFKRTSGYIEGKFGIDALREIRLHEIVHFLRLTPYKIRKAQHSGLLFFGCLCLLIDSYMDDFETA
ncbi:MAG: lysylphosphatidylglycerol synthase transmembrane domain-containing protein [Alphaproteobacteria bacterium]|nr:lysylphosphatidylglycerol synthase transmembrane domain-containing protein [Alphaproteobacteria bacterium]